MHNVASKPSAQLHWFAITKCEKDCRPFITILFSLLALFTAHVSFSFFSMQHLIYHLSNLYGFTQQVWCTSSHLSNYHFVIYFLIHAWIMAGYVSLGCSSLLLPSQCHSNGLGNLGNLSSSKEIQPYSLLHALSAIWTVKSTAGNLYTISMMFYLESENYFRQFVTLLFHLSFIGFFFPHATRLLLHVICDALAYWSNTMINEKPVIVLYSHCACIWLI